VNPPFRYQSPLACPDLEPYFKHATPIDYRNLAGHTSLHDNELFAGCGYATHDEAAILYYLARLFPGIWIEIGAHTGWTSSHLAAGEAIVLAFEPEFTHAGYNRTGSCEKFFARYMENTQAVGKDYGFGVHTMVSPDFSGREVMTEAGPIVGTAIMALRQTSHGGAIIPVGRKSQDILRNLAFKGLPIAGVFIDGEHEPPFPLLDTMLALNLGASVIAYHDAIGSPVQAGMMYAEEHGYSRHVFHTPQFVGVACRDVEGLRKVRALGHRPDASVDWVSYTHHLQWNDRDLYTKWKADAQKWFEDSPV
jgi:hypothetical protein